MLAGPDVMAVVKSDGYGHGMLPTAPPRWLAERPGSAWAKSLRESRCARRASPRRCSACSPRPTRRIGRPSSHGIDLRAGTASLVRRSRRRRSRPGRPARLHLKADTGMSRGGADGGDWPELVAAALAEQAAGRCEIIGIWSHLACADIPGHPSVDAQVAAFGDALDQASGSAPGRSSGTWPTPRRC